MSRWEAEIQIIKEMDAAGSTIDKVNLMKKKICAAKTIYSTLPEDYFDIKSKSTHLDMWLGGLNEFERIIEGI